MITPISGAVLVGCVLVSIPLIIRASFLKNEFDAIARKARK